MTQPLVLVHDTKFAAADDVDNAGVYLTLEDALTLSFPTDAHYQSCCLASANPDDLGARWASSSIIPPGDDLVHHVVSFDVDTPGHVALADAPEAWSDQMRHFLHHTDLGSSCSFYATRGGYRLLFVLRQPVGYDQYGAAVRLLGAELDKAGCPRHDALHDFARMMRLPFVRRDGQDTDPGEDHFRLHVEACSWHPTYDELKAAAEERPVAIRRRLADGSVDGVAYSGHATEPRPAAPMVLPAVIARVKDVQAFQDGQPLSHPGQRHGDTLAALGRVAKGLGSRSTPELLYAILHPAYQAMCEIYPDSSLDKLWDLAHHVDAKHKARLANGEQEDESTWLSVVELVDRIKADATLLNPKAQAAMAPIEAEAEAIMSMAVKPWDPCTLEALYQKAIDATQNEHIACGFLWRALQNAGTYDPKRRSWPLLVALQAGGASDLWVFDRYTGGYTGPTNPRALLSVLKRCGWASFGFLVNPDKGQLASPLDHLLMEYGAVVQEVQTFYGDATSCDHVEADANNGAGILHLAGARLRDDLTPAFDPQIDRWLQLLAGDDATLHAHLNLWLAAVPDASNVSLHTIPALMLLGRKGTGKTLLAHGLAALWATKPISHEEAFGQFNARLAKSPIVDGSEFSGSLLKPGRSGHGTDIRVMVSQAPKAIEQKFVAATTLVGAPRIVLSANDYGSWEDSQLDSDSHAALVDRIAILQPTAEAELHLLAMKAQDPERLARWAESGIAEHVLALQARTDFTSRNPLLNPSPRFRVPTFGHDSGDADTLRRIGDDGRIGLGALTRGALLGAWAPLHQAEDLLVCGEKLYVTQNTLGVLVERQCKSTKASTVRKVVDKLTGIGRCVKGTMLPRPLRTRGTRKAEDQRRYIVVPMALLVAFAEHEGLEFDKPACAVYDDQGVLVKPAN